MSKLASSSFEEEQVKCAEASLKAGQVITLSRSLEGKLLTICDTATVGQQNKAIKDLVRDALRDFRFKVEAVAGNAGDEFSIGVPLADIEVVGSEFEIPTMQA